jgi:S1-C subfamily serine protease
MKRRKKMRIGYRFIWFGIVLGVLLLISPRQCFSQQKVLTSLENDIITLVENIKLSLVTIETESSIKSGARREELPPTFVGSGVIYTADGNIITTASVVRGMREFKITLPNRKPLPGVLVGTDEGSNLAVLKVDVTGLVPAKLGDSDKIKVGSWLTVVGNSYGLPNAVALGLVNGVRDDGFIQMSANVSPGNSGGPVLDTYGNVIGLVSAKMSEPSYISSIQIYEKAMNKTITIPSREIDIPSSGMSLALPANKIKAIADEIIKHGNVKRGYLGIYPADLNDELSAEYNTKAGVLVSEVVPGSPAEKAGLTNGDVILEFGGTKVNNSTHIRQLIESKMAGDKVELKVVRDGTRKDLTAVLGQAKPVFSYFWSTDQVPPAPQIDYLKTAETFRRSQEILQQSDESLEQLKVEVRALQDKMQKLNQEIEKLKQEKSKQ